MAVKLLIQFNSKQLTIPINPEKITISRNASNTDVNIIGLGKTVRKGEPGLIQLDIDSFFPGPNSYFYTGVNPKTCIDFINEIWEAENVNNNVGKLITSGLPNDLNMYFVIEDFDYDHRAGEEEDIYYTLRLKKYIPYGVKTVSVDLSGLAAARASSAASTSSQNSGSSGTNNTYTVQRNDCLWNIAKACTGDGSRWSELYNLNKGVIGSNPNLIYPGQVLTLPSGWDTPISVPKLSNVSNSGSSPGIVVVAAGAAAAQQAISGGGSRRRRSEVVGNEIGVIFTK